MIKVVGITRKMGKNIPVQPEETFGSSLLFFCNFSRSESLKGLALIRGGALTVTNFLEMI